MSGNLREKYIEEGWGKLAVEAGFDPVETEASARVAFRFCHVRIRLLEEEIKRLKSGE